MIKKIAVRRPNDRARGRFPNRRPRGEKRFSRAKAGESKGLFLASRAALAGLTSPDVAEGFRRQNSKISVHALTEWDAGQYLGASDEIIMEAAEAQKLTLVTYDLKTIPTLLKTWMEIDRDHAGVIFVDSKTIAAQTSEASQERCWILP